MRFEYFQMIDRIVAVDVAARRVRATCQVPLESTIFEGHFPGYPLMPGALLVECMAQTVGWLVLALGKFTGMPFMVGVKEAKFRTPVLPGETIDFEGEVIHEGSGFAVGACKGLRQGSVVCNGQITYRIQPFPNAEFRESLNRWAERIEFPIREYMA
jgi:3-hydroxyacyl-[acyl-carrier-protein] dehydratase